MSTPQVRASQSTGVKVGALRCQSSQSRRSRGARHVGRRTLTARSYVSGHNGIWPAPGPAWKRLSLPDAIWRPSGEVSKETAESLRTFSASV